MTNHIPSLLAGLLVLGAPLALTGCETETQTEIESDGDVDRDVELGVDDAAVDEFQNDAANLGDEIEEGAEQVGNDIEAGADAAGEEVDNAIQDAQN